jgi:hypothetical protein
MIMHRPPSDGVDGGVATVWKQFDCRVLIREWVLDALCPWWGPLTL